MKLCDFFKMKRSIKIDDKLLGDLGFRFEFVPEEVSGGMPFSYWCLDLASSFSLITNASDEIVDGAWTVYLFDGSEIAITNGRDLIDLVNIIRRNTKIL